jgi:hypothetical protein
VLDGPVQPKRQLRAQSRLLICTRFYLVWLAAEKVQNRTFWLLRYVRHSPGNRWPARGVQPGMMVVMRFSAGSSPPAGAARGRRLVVAGLIALLGLAACSSSPRGAAPVTGSAGTSAAAGRLSWVRRTYYGAGLAVTLTQPAAWTPRLAPRGFHYDAALAYLANFALRPFCSPAPASLTCDPRPTSTYPAGGVVVTVIVPHADPTASMGATCHDGVRRPHNVPRELSPENSSVTRSPIGLTFARFEGPGPAPVQQGGRAACG